MAKQETPLRGGQRTRVSKKKLSSRAQRGTCLSLSPASYVLPPPRSKGARISLSGAVVRTKKDKGYLAEMAFVTKAMSLGFNVCKPLGETPGFDFVVESGRRVCKVQMKSGWAEWHGGYPVKLSNAHRNYRADETDFIVVYIIPEDAWYVMPIAAVSSPVPSPTDRARTSHGKFLSARHGIKSPPRDLPRRLASPRPPSPGLAQGAAIGKPSLSGKIFEWREARTPGRPVQTRARPHRTGEEVGQDLAATPRSGRLGSPGQLVVLIRRLSLCSHGPPVRGPEPSKG